VAFNILVRILHVALHPSAFIYNVFKLNIRRLACNFELPVRMLITKQVVLDAVLLIAQLNVVIRYSCFLCFPLQFIAHLIRCDITSFDNSVDKQPTNQPKVDSTVKSGAEL
jgi:hypothetical protein